MNDTYEIACACSALVPQGLCDDCFEAEKENVIRQTSKEKGIKVEINRIANQYTFRRGIHSWKFDIYEKALEFVVTSKPQRIVCAALRKGDRMILGARHRSSAMLNQIHASEGIEFWKGADVEQGFVDQFDEFLTREEAWQAAKKTNQIVRDKDWRVGTLHSEHLY